MKKCIAFCAVICSFFSINAQTTAIKGLTVIVNYSDYTLNATTAQISSMMNQASGYTNWGNNGSVNQYYTVQSNGKINLTSQVISVNLTHVFNYYHGDNLPYNGGVELVKDAVAAINAKYPSGFAGLTKHPSEDRVWHFNILCTGPKGLGVCYGFDENLFVKNDGANISIRNVSLIGYTSPETPDINTICHEFGHSIFGWTDYYISTEAGGSTNLGHYCLMGSGGIKGSPMPIDAGLRYIKGWISTVTELSNTTQTYTVTANSRGQVFKYTNANNPKEYFLIEALKHGGYYIPLTGDGYVPDEGIIVWYIDEDGGLDKPVSTPNPRIKVIQADGLDEMHDLTKTHHDLRGDDTDLFDSLSYSGLSDASHPLFRWKDGSNTGLIISNISAVGTTMTFKVNARANTITATTDANGKISPKGLVNVVTGKSQKFTFTPNFGYVVNKVTVNGSSKGSSSTYTFSNVTSSQTIAVTYKATSSSTALKSPWKKADIGTPITAGNSGYLNGVFKIETKGSDIWGNSDNFHFVYQPLNGNAEIVTRIADMNKPQEWSKSGLMIRESLAADAKHIMIVKTPFNGIATQWRTNTADGNDNHNDPALKNIVWLKLKRLGDTFTTYYSTDGSTWTLFDTRTISMQSNVYIGLCATGGTTNTANITLFDKVKVTLTSSAARLVKPELTKHTQNLSAFPNPFADKATITIPAGAGEAELTVTNASGAVIERRKVRGTITLGGNYANGIYFVQVKTGNQIRTLKIIKQE